MNAPANAPGELWCWRHPAARHAAGRCIGRTDLPVDPRKAKRLAHGMRRAARLHGLPRRVWVSPLRRAHAVGLWLRRWGWQLRVDPRLQELDFGRWDGRAWADVPWAEVEAWQADLLHHAPGGGESLAQLALRVHAWAAECGPLPCLVVAHGGSINALRVMPPGAARLPASGWPIAPRHGSLTRVVVLAPAR
jgi:alpha-ribazole phosphatase